MTNYIDKFLDETSEISKKIDRKDINKVIKRVKKVKDSNGRIFFLGVGGSAGNCSHAVNDFRKIAKIECYTPLDNVSELTARINDDSWETVFSTWLKSSNLNSKDLLFILSVGGGNQKKKVSVNLIEAINYAKVVNCDVVGIVSRDGGYTYKNSYACIKIPTVNNDNVTPHAEGWQAVIWHLIVTDPRILKNINKWESLQNK